MNKLEALTFLRQHQPLPPDNQLTEELIEQYRQSLDYCRASRDVECVPLLLNVFGKGSGWDTYQLADEILWQFAPVDVLPHLLQSLRSKYMSVRYWSAEIAAVFPFPELIAPLQEMLAEEDEDNRSVAVRALAFIDDAQVDALLRDRLQQEQSADTRELIEQVLVQREHVDFHTIARGLRKNLSLVYRWNKIRKVSS